MFPTLFAALTLLLPPADSRPELRKIPAPDPPVLRPEQPPAGEITPPAARRKFFGLGIGFSTRANAQGIALDQVVAASPADRAGLTAGTVIAEINGESMLGRSGEDCTRVVRESGNAVVIKYYDPATQKLRTRTLEKDWFLLPN